MVAIWNARRDHQEAGDADVACNVEGAIAHVRMHQASVRLLHCIEASVGGQA